MLLLQLTWGQSPAHTPVLQQQPLVDVDGLWVVGAHVVYGGQAQLVLRHILQVLVEAHQLFLIVELRQNNFIRRT